MGVAIRKHQPGIASAYGLKLADDLLATPHVSYLPLTLSNNLHILDNVNACVFLDARQRIPSYLAAEQSPRDEGTPSPLDCLGVHSPCTKHCATSGLWM